MSSFETDVLADLIHRKRHCLVQLRTLGVKQLELVRAGETADLLDVLAAKQHLLAQLQRLERNLDPFRSQDPESRRWRTPDDRRQCAAELASCETLLAEIVRQERQSESELTRRRDEASAQLQGVHSAQQAHRAYLAPAAPAPRALDLTSEGY